MKKIFGGLVLCLLAISLLGCQDYKPKKMGNPLGMYMYHGSTKTLLGQSESRQIVEEIEFEGNIYPIIITDYYNFDNNFYFCAEFDDNNYVGLFRYSYDGGETQVIYIKNVSQSEEHIQLSIHQFTIYFISLEQCSRSFDEQCGLNEFGSHEYFSVDYQGNVIDTGFDPSEKYSDTVAYTAEYRLTREYDGENVFAIEHLITHEKIVLGRVQGYMMAYHLRYYETEELFCFVTQKTVNDYYVKYLVIYHKQSGELYHELWGISDDAFVIDIKEGLFYADKSIYQFREGEGLVIIHTAPYYLASCTILHNGIIAFAATDKVGMWTDYYFDQNSNQIVSKPKDYYSYIQYYFDGYIFYVTERSKLMWTTYYYLRRVNLKTKKNEIVHYTVNSKIRFDRIGY